MTTRFDARGRLPMNDFQDAHVVVLGGAGFLGTNVCRRLLDLGAEVTCIDSMITGSLQNLRDLDTRRFSVVEHDISYPVDMMGPVDFVMNLASPASPVDYYRYPIETLEVGSKGTANALNMALRADAVFLLASTSEVYGDPLMHPQPETYWGNVNPIGPRSVYDEAKRFSEALTTAYRSEYGLRTRIARIFNTYGPYMNPHDGRAVPAFFKAAITNTPLVIHGDGSQTRSLCYVDDLVDGLLSLMLSDEKDPVNLGNPEEVTIMALAETIQDVVGNYPGVILTERPTDDPSVRRPDITKARTVLEWSPRVSLREGLTKTLPWFQKVSF